MGTQYLIDTNAVIEFLGGRLPSSGSNWLQNLIDENRHHLSVINQIELLSFTGSTAEMMVLKDFINASNVLSLSDVIVQKTIDLRQTYRIKLPDAVIAATALIHSLTIVTRNTSDFHRITGLSLVNAHDK